MGRGIRAVVEPLLEKPPSEKLFRSICRALGKGNPPKAVSEIVDDVLASWPDSVPRCASDPWLRAVGQGKKCAALRLCRTIDIEGRTDISTPLFSAFIGSPYASEIETIFASHMNLGDAGVAALGSSKHLRRVRVLRLSAAGIGDDGLRALVAHKSLSSVIDLSIGGNPISDEGIAALVSSPLFGRLETFWVDSLSEITEASIGALISADRSVPLRVLMLSGWPLGTGGLEQLLSSPLLRELHVLHIGRTGLGPSAATAFAQVDLPRLEHLDLSHNPLGDDATIAIAESLPCIRKLVTLGCDLEK